MSKDCYGFLTGTSQAAPMVAATAALILSLNPALTPPEVKQIILNSADQLPSLDRKIVSNRQINIGKAVTSATAFQGLSATLNPIDDHL